MCDHLEALKARRDPVTPSAAGCAECLASGDGWVHLRLCLACGHVGCCDDSPNHHATRHYQQTGHRVIKSFEPGEAWAWCFEDEELAPEIRSFRGESPRRHLDPPGEGAAGEPR
jgi:uncharacterized UBP type Zn finger protein